MSTTVTFIEQLALLPEVSVAEKVTVVVPRGYTGSALLVMVGSGSQMSVAVAVKGTTVPSPVSCSTVTSSGHVITGGVVSTTKDTAELLIFPAISSANTTNELAPSRAIIVMLGVKVLFSAPLRL